MAHRTALRSEFSICVLRGGCVNVPADPATPQTAKGPPEAEHVQRQSVESSEPQELILEILFITYNVQGPTPTSKLRERRLISKNNLWTPLRKIC